MKKTLCITILVGGLFGLIIIGCKKEFLAAKPSTDIIQPTTIEEFQRLLDNRILNTGPALSLFASDEYVYSNSATWLSVRTATWRNSYIWAKDLYEGEISEHWNIPFTTIFYANNVIEGLDKIKQTPINKNEWILTKGWALFLRAYAFYDLANNFAKPYDATSASKDLGIPLRLKPSIDELVPRSTIQETFARILEDLTNATQMLDSGLPMGRTRPSKVAAHALFAKIYLNMREYTNAELHADSSLALYSKLIDYKTLNKTINSPFAYNHDEMIFAKSGISGPANSGNNAASQISTDVISMYSPNDLRLLIYFIKQADGTYDKKAGYNGPGIGPFTGLATDEVYLIKAECAARRGAINIAMDVLNKLLINRWDPNATVPSKPYDPVKANDRDDAVAKVLLERRKELVWRGIRWDDLKRLNKEGSNITLVRTINEETYTLPPNSLNYVFPIPENEINLSNIQQNERQ